MRSCIRITQICAGLALFAAAAGAQTTNESMAVGPGTLNYEKSQTGGICDAPPPAEGHYTTYTFHDFSFVASGLNQSLGGGWRWTIPPPNPVGCPFPPGLDGTSPPFNLTGSSGYTITITSISAQSFNATYSGPFAALSTGSLTFANQSIGTASAAQDISISNTGTTNLSISSASISGPNSGEFVIQSNSCGTVAANASCTISIVFSPTAFGVRSASLTISDNSPTSPHTVALSGSGEIGTSVHLLARNIVSGTHTYTATDTLSAGSGGFTIGGSASVVFGAGNQIILQPGFHATAGTAPITFQAVIGTIGGSGIQFTIGGHVTYKGAGMQGVPIALTGSSSGTAGTDANGNYSFTVNFNGNYTITPSLPGYTVTPASRTFYSLSSNQTANFSALLAGDPGSQPNPAKEFIRFNGQVVAVENK